MADRRRPSRRAQRVMQRQRRRRLQVVIAGLAVVVIALVVAVALSSGGSSDDDAAVVEVEMFEWGFSGDLTAPAGPVRLSAVNTGAIPHNIGIRRGPITSEVRPGGSVDLDLGDLTPGTYELYCDLIGHEEAGMVADLEITEPDGA